MPVIATASHAHGDDPTIIRDARARLLRSARNDGAQDVDARDKPGHDESVRLSTQRSGVLDVLLEAGIDQLALHQRTAAPCSRA